MKIVIVGGGLSGIIASIILEKKHDVTLIEKNSEFGKKILVTGNGHANFWHDNISTNNYLTDNKELLDIILSYQEDAYKFLINELNICPINRDGYYYPFNREAKSFRDLLISHLNKTKVLLNTEVNKIKKINNEFKVSFNNQVITCDKVIISTGSTAYYNKSNTYELLNSFHLPINKVLPGLVKIKVKENINSLTGVRVSAKVSLIVDNKEIKVDTGELQFNKNYLSGICIFNLSNLCNRELYNKKDVLIKINYFDNIEKVLMDYPNTKLNILLKTIFPNKLLNYFFNELNINGEKTYNELSNKEQESLINIISNNLYHPIIDNNHTEQICTGGLSLNSINEKLEVNDIKNLYVLGELLDVSGDCGGYNMAFAIITGYLVGVNND